ncbi:hypothetical protein [Rhodococcus artemisiae]|uniref:Uncharacterized protein n=1 Tax=Rhodococcus artemisiae TaxID=714159 RepID=A0ABU7L3Y0_9NOCA|nr:hypothetical protein [Rhodococcus artemisiae]MEE2056244.1 hypothetical protein [Rhodococcus artemisiae]
MRTSTTYSYDTADRIDISDSDRVPLELDEALTCGGHRARLIATHDPGTDIEYVLLLLGEMSGHSEVVVREVDEEALLIEGSRSSPEPQILLGASSQPLHDTGDTDALARVLRKSGIVRSMIARGGVRSVIVGPRRRSESAETIQSPPRSSEARAS